MTLAVVLLLSTAVSPGPVAPLLAIEISESHIRVDARGASLVSILEELASRLDVRLVIDGPPPTMPVTLVLDQPHLPGVLHELLEPRRIRYATSKRGEHIRALVVVTKSEVRPSGPTPTPEPTSAPFADSVPEPVLPDRPSPPDEAPAPPAR